MKRLLLTALIAFSSPALAQESTQPPEENLVSSLPACEGKKTSKWDNCFGVKKESFNRKLTYKGEFKAGKKHGQGTYTWKDGTNYVGEWKNNKFHGQGTYSFSSGDKYVGEWKNDEEYGQGTYTHANGNKYDGKWKAGAKHGQGTWTQANGIKYEGEWKNGYKSGLGTLTYPDGNQYKGDWENDLKNGQGTFTFANGDMYIGEWKDDQSHGQGTYGFPTGDIYIGTYTNGKMDDVKMFYTNQYKSDTDRLIKTNLPKCRTGIFNDCYATYMYNGNLKYHGEFIEYKRNGHGVMTFDDGTNYIGYFRNGLFHGQGEMNFTNGLKRNGLWYSNQYVPTLCTDNGFTKGTDSHGQCILKYMDLIKADKDTDIKNAAERKRMIAEKAAQKIADDQEAERRKMERNRRILAGIGAALSAASTPPDFESSNNNSNYDDDMVKCQKMGNTNGPIVLFKYSCGAGYNRVW